MNKEKNHQQLDFGFTVEANKSKHTPLLAPQDRQEREPACWFDVRAKAASFLVRASHEVFVAQQLRSHLSEPLHPHMQEGSATKASLFGIELEEILDELDIQALSDQKSSWYDGILPTDVVIVGTSA